MVTRRATKLLIATCGISCGLLVLLTYALAFLSPTRPVSWPANLAQRASWCLAVEPQVPRATGDTAARDAVVSALDNFVARTICNTDLVQRADLYKLLDDWTASPAVKLSQINTKAVFIGPPREGFEGVHTLESSLESGGSGSVKLFTELPEGVMRYSGSQSRVLLVQPHRAVPHVSRAGVVYTGFADRQNLTAFADADMVFLFVELPWTSPSTMEQVRADYRSVSGAPLPDSFFDWLQLHTSISSLDAVLVAQVCTARFLFRRAVLILHFTNEVPPPTHSDSLRQVLEDVCGAYFATAGTTRAAQLIGTTVGFPTLGVFYPVNVARLQARKEQFRAEGVSIDRHKLVYMSAPSKGLTQTVQAFRQLLKHDSRYRLYVARPSYASGDLSAYGVTPDVQDFVISVGVAGEEAVHRHLSTALALFYPSQYFETFGYVLVESNCLGIPVVFGGGQGSGTEVLDLPEAQITGSDLELAVKTVLHWTEHPEARPSPQCLHKYSTEQVVRRLMYLWRYGAQFPTYHSAVWSNILEPEQSHQAGQ